VIQRKIIFVHPDGGIAVRGLIPLLALYIVLMGCAFWGLNFALEQVLNLWDLIVGLFHYPAIHNPLTGCFVGRS
jgi:hypothetical protein